MQDRSRPRLTTSYPSVLTIGANQYGSVKLATGRVNQLKKQDKTTRYNNNVRNVECTYIKKMRQHL